MPAPIIDKNILQGSSRERLQRFWPNTFCGYLKGAIACVHVLKCP
jgi:hypothetical protein